MNKNEDAISENKKDFDLTTKFFDSYAKDIPNWYRDGVIDGEIKVLVNTKDLRVSEVKPALTDTYPFRVIFEGDVVGEIIPWVHREIPNDDSSKLTAYWGARISFGGPHAWGYGNGMTPIAALDEALLETKRNCQFIIDVVTQMQAQLEESEHTTIQ